MPEAPTVPNMVAQSMGRILRDSTHTKYTVQDKIQKTQTEQCNHHMALCQPAPDEVF